MQFRRFSKAVVVLAAFLLTGTGCSRHYMLEQALEQAGDNRPELEAVLEHYRASDSLREHWQAARFLIANMPGHQTRVYRHMASDIEALDAGYPEMSLAVKSVVCAMLQNASFGPFEPLEDVRNIKAEWLIGHIDNRMEARQQCPWLREMDFEDFCEYVLPYRFAEEPLWNHPDSSARWWKALLNTAEDYSSLPVSMDNLRHLQRNMVGTSDNKYMQHLKLSPDACESYDFDCLDKCFYDVSLQRNAGIPIAVDYVPEWPTRNGRHYWRVLMDASWPDGQCPDLEGPPRAAKVYRMTYSRQTLPKTAKNEYLPPLFRNPFVRDVTSHYVNVSDVKVRYRLRRGMPRNVCLAVFNDLEWKPIAISRRTGRTAVFRDMGRNVVYLPVWYDADGFMHHCGYPFLLDVKGEMHRLEPRYSETASFGIARKYPLTVPKVLWSWNLRGCVVEASDESGFGKADTLHIIDSPDSNLGYRVIHLGNRHRSYRYVRLSLPGKRFSLGELTFWDADGNLIEGEVMNAAADKLASRAFDQDILTYTNTLSWVGLDFVRPVQISAIGLVSRTDANAIQPGFTYSLLYFGEDGWTEHETVQACTTSLTFNDVPSNALLWLRNLDEGREERIFTVENGAVQFW